MQTNPLVKVVSTPSESSDESSELNQQVRGRAPTIQTRCLRSRNIQIREAEPTRPRTRRIPPTRFTLKKLDDITAMRMQGAFAKSTWQRRQMLDREWASFQETMRLSPTAGTALRFFSWLGTNLQDTSLHTYVTTFLALHPELKCPDTRNYLRGLKMTGGLRPTSQVPGLTKEEAYKVLQACPPPLQLAFFIAWKTASRWADVRSLTPGDMTLISPNEAALMFPTTKATWMRPFRPDLLVHIVHDSDITRLLGQALRLHPSRPITNVTTQQITKIIRDVTGNKRLSSRSIKRGAADLLMTAASKGLVPVETVGRLLKHAKTPQLIHDTSVRYTTNKAMLAVALGSGKATKLL